MKQITEYLLTKKKHDVQSYIDQYVVYPSNKIFYEVKLEYKDKEIQIKNNGFQFWLLCLNDILCILEKFNEAEINYSLKVFTFPNKYDIDYIKSGNLKYDELTKIDPYELK